MRGLNILFATAALMVAAASAFAVEVGPVNYQIDRNGKTGNITNSSIFVNQAQTNGSTSTSATCPGDANKILFLPADTGGNFRTKANGSGAPAAGNVTDGTGWAKNLADWQDINVAVSGTMINSYAVFTSAADNVPYICGKK